MHRNRGQKTHKKLWIHFRIRVTDYVFRVTIVEWPEVKFDFSIVWGAAPVPPDFSIPENKGRSPKAPSNAIFLYSL